MTYAFQLGREPLLSVWEILSVFPELRLNIFDESIAAGEGGPEVKKMFPQLGGSVKLGKFVQKISLDSFLASPETLIVQCVEESADKDFSGSFAINFFGAFPKSLQKNKKQIGIRVKKLLRGTFDHVRYVESDTQQTSSVTVRRNKLLRGADLWLVLDHATVHVFSTIDVQNYKDFSSRDFGRPRRDAQNGMLPPKLARMMLHIAGVTAASVVLDPFVGSGTVLQEATMLGVHKVYGSDISGYAVDDTEANLEWLEKTTNNSILYSLHARDIHTLDPMAYQDVTHIVTELDLGEPLRSHATQQDARRYSKEAHELFSACVSFASHLPNLSSLVLAIPYWQGDKGHYYVERQDAKPFRQQQLPEEIRALFPTEISPFGGMLYARASQFVGREIIHLVKT